MVYQKNFHFTVATVINILHHSILVKQQIQNFEVLMKLISDLFLHLFQLVMLVYANFAVQWTYYLLLLYRVTITFAFSISFC